MMTFFYRAVSRFKDKQKRKKQERREGETAQEDIPEQQDDTDQYEGCFFFLYKNVPQHHHRLIFMFKANFLFYLAC